MKRELFFTIILTLFLIACGAEEKKTKKSQKKTTTNSSKQTKKAKTEKKKSEKKIIRSYGREHYIADGFEKGKYKPRKEQEEFYNKLLNDRKYRPHRDYTVDKWVQVYNLPVYLRPLALRHAIIRTKRGDIGLVALAPWKYPYTVVETYDSILIQGQAYYCVQNCYYCNGVGHLKDPKEWKPSQARQNVKNNDCAEREVILVFDKVTQQGGY